MQRLTKRQIMAERDALVAAGERQRVLWDSDVKGLGVRLTKAGALAFLDYRDATRARRRLAIGKVLPPELTVEQARAKAAAYRVDVRAGKDPLGERRKSKVVGMTVEQALRDWIAARTNPKSDRRWSPVTEREYRRIIEKDIIPAIGQLALAAVTRQALMAPISAIAKRSSSMAAATFRVLGSFVRHCDAMGLIEGVTMPTAKVVASPPKPRTRRPDDGPPHRHLARYGRPPAPLAGIGAADHPNRPAAAQCGTHGLERARPGSRPLDHSCLEDEGPARARGCSDRICRAGAQGAARPISAPIRVQ